MYIWHKSAIVYLKEINYLSYIITKIGKVHYIDNSLLIEDESLEKYFLVDSDSIHLECNTFKDTYITHSTFGSSPDEYTLIEKAKEKNYKIVMYIPTLSRFNVDKLYISIFDILLELFKNKVLTEQDLKNIYKNHKTIYKNNDLSKLNNIPSFHYIRNLCNI